jgi:hypothetical protein
LNHWRYVDNGDGRWFLKVSIETRSESLAVVQTIETIIDLSTLKVTEPSALSPDATTRLIRSGNALQYGSVETRRAGLSLQGNQWTARDPVLKSNSVAIPDSIVQRKTSYCWNLFANEPQFYALQSVPERSGLTSREILVYNRLKGAWNSLDIPGARTRLRSFGTWLGGVVTDPDPATNYEKRFGGPPVPRQDVVLVNPLELRSFTVHLGEWCELLSIEGDVVFYRIEKELYRARIQDDDFVDRQLILKDLQVVGINWAFSGRECGPLPEPSHQDSLVKFRSIR